MNQPHAISWIIWRKATWWNIQQLTDCQATVCAQAFRNGVISALLCKRRKRRYGGRCVTSAGRHYAGWSVEQLASCWHIGLCLTWKECQLQMNFSLRGMHTFSLYEQWSGHLPGFS